MQKQIRFSTILFVFLALHCLVYTQQINESLQKQRNTDYSDLQIESGEGKKVVVNINLMRASSNSNLGESGQGSFKTIQVNLNLGESESSSRCQVERNQSVDIQSFCPKDKWLTNNDLQPTNKRFIRVNTRYGNQMFIDSYDGYKSQELKKNGITYPANIYLIGKFLKKGAKWLNLGSHNGMETMIAGRSLGPCGRIYIFEPYSASYRVVRKNLEINGLLNISTTYNVAAHKQSGQSNLYISFENTGRTSVVNQKWAKDLFTEKIKLRKVDDVLPEDVQLDFALIDVQRVEANALYGMKKVIQRSPNLVMMVQWQGQFDVPLAKDVLNFLLGLGYKMYRYIQKNSPCQFGTFEQIKTIEDLLKIPSLDVLFVPKTVELPK